MARPRGQNRTEEPAFPGKQGSNVLCLHLVQSRGGTREFRRANGECVCVCSETGDTLIQVVQLISTIKNVQPTYTMAYVARVVNTTNVITVYLEDSTISMFYPTQACL